MSSSVDRRHFFKKSLGAGAVTILSKVGFRKFLQDGADFL